MKRKTVLYTLLAAALLLVGLSWSEATANPGILYVKKGGRTIGFCDSWQEACNLQYALYIATVGDQIWVTQGTYHPGVTGDRSSTFQLKTGVAIYGGFAGDEASLSERDWDANVVVLSGDLNSNGHDDNDSYHVVMGADGAILDGVTVSGGNANGSERNDSGGGMYNYYISPSLINITFTDNMASSGGGGMYNDFSNPSLTNVLFFSNEADWGGGMSNFYSYPTFDNVIFFGNFANINGGGMYNSSSSLSLTNVTFSANMATYAGGGIDNQRSDINSVNVTLSSNWAGEQGGGMRNYHSDPNLTNVTFSGNSSPVGGGINNYGSNPSLTNVTMLNNHAPTGDGINNDPASSSTLVNCIVWGDGDQIEGLAIVTYSDIARNEGLPPYPGTGNINANPLLAPLAYNGGSTLTHALLLGSPAIDAGTNNGCPSTDQRGLIRPIGTCDMGSYEYGYEFFVPLAMK